MRAMKKVEQGLNTGFLLRWRPGVGDDLPPGGVLPGPNGIQLSKDGTVAYVAIGGNEGEVRKIDLVTGATLGVAKVSHPDNISWTPEGTLLVASLPPDSDTASCMRQGFDRPCGAAFDIVEVDPKTMTRTIRLSHKGAPLGMATVAVRTRDALYVGSAAGDRLLKTPLPGAAAP